MMADTVKKITEPATIATMTLTVTRGVTAGWIAGIPQVLLAQAVGSLLGIREHADIGPRFMRHAAEYAARPLSPPMHWLLGGVFHFEYAAWWGAIYALVVDLIGARRVPPLLSGVPLGGIIYAAAFSPLGAATRTGAERKPEQRSIKETVVHCTAAFSFAWTTSFSYRWLRERW
jgi:hypothetical protein